MSFPKNPADPQFAPGEPFHLPTMRRTAENARVAAENVFAGGGMSAYVHSGGVSLIDQAPMERFVRITGQSPGGSSNPPEWYYSHEPVRRKLLYDEDTGLFSIDPDDPWEPDDQATEGSYLSFPLVEINSRDQVEVGTVQRCWLSDTGDALEFDAGVQLLRVAGVDFSTTPVVHEDIETLQFYCHPDYNGVYLTTTGPGHVQVNIIAASDTRAGTVSTQFQYLGGRKHFVGGVTTDSLHPIWFLDNSGDPLTWPGTGTFGSIHYRTGGLFVRCSGSGTSWGQLVIGTTGCYFGQSDFGNNARWVFSGDTGMGGRFELFSGTGEPQVRFAVDGSLGGSTTTGGLTFLGGIYTGGAISVGIDGLSDVVITAPTAGETIKYNGSQWVNDELILDDLGDVEITTPALGEFLVYDGSGWINLPADLNLLSDVAITAPAAGDVLYYDGADWVNEALTLDLADDVVLTAPAPGDVLTFDGADWVNAPASSGDLDDLGDVVVTTPATGQVLRYNGTNWVNVAVATLAITLDNLADVVISSPANNQFIRYNGTNWVNATVALVSALDDLSDVVITTPANNQFLRYNGSNWVNATVSLVSAIDDLSDVVITGVASGDLLRYNGSNWVNFVPDYVNAEGAQDAIGSALTDTDTIDMTYNDGANTIKADARLQMSLTSDSSGIKLSGDATTPGNRKYYGTNPAGTKGWHDSTNGAGAGGGIETTAVKTANYSPASGELVLCNTSGGAFTVTLPASPSPGDRIGIALVTAGNNLTVDRNGKNIDSAASNLTISAAGTIRTLQYTGTQWLTVGAEGQAVLSSSFTASSTGNFQDSGLDVTVPVAGLYELCWNARVAIQVSGSDGFMITRLYNETDAAAISDTDRLMLYVPAGDTTIRQIHSAYSHKVNLAAAKVIRVDVKRDSSGSPTWTFSSLSSDSNGRTTLTYRLLT